MHFQTSSPTIPAGTSTLRKPRPAMSAASMLGAVLLCAIGLAASVQAAQGKSIYSIKFQGAPTGSTATSNSTNATPMAATEVTGFIPRGNWNNVLATSDHGTSSALINQNGLIPGPTVSWTNSSGTGLNNAVGNGVPDSPGGQRMMRTYLGCNPSSTLVVQVNSLPASFGTAPYDV